jgi:hypothetical protein
MPTVRTTSGITNSLTVKTRKDAKIDYKNDADVIFKFLEEYLPSRTFYYLKRNMSGYKTTVEILEG